ncbi:MAG: hypothetical protein JWM76_3443 [Pseudonocardiales bacterium]|nr:hypothetical protein [Pseudonocardiales bacterium]
MRRTVHVWYDRAGNIAAVGEPIGRYHVVPRSHLGLNAVEVEVDSDEIEDLHRTHRADPDTGRLIAMDD